MPGSLTAPFVDQPGFTDQAGNAFTMWAYVVTRLTWFGSSVKTVRKNWQPVVGQDTIDFDSLPGGNIGLPVSAPIVPVTSVAGLTAAVGAESLADVLSEFMPIPDVSGKLDASAVGGAFGVAPLGADSKVPDASLPTRLADATLNATYEPKGAAATAAAPKLDKTEAATTYAPRSGKAFSGLKQSLADSRHCSIGGQGDSTGNEPTEWVALLATSIGAANPSYTVRHWVWNDTTQLFDRPVSIQTGAAGRASVTTGGVSPAWYGPAMGNDLDVRINLKNVNWANGAVQTLVARQGASGSYGFKFGLNSTGLMTLTWSSDGTTFNATKFGNTAPFAANAEGWVRATLKADNGAAGNDVKFWQSADGATWTQVGSTITTAGVTTVYQPTAWPFEFGSRNLGGEPLTAGSQVYEVQIRDGIDGPLLCPPNPCAWLLPSVSGGGFTGTMNGAPVLDVFNGSKPGADITYLNDATRLPKMLPLVAPMVIFLSDSHNENQTSGPLFITKYKAWVDAVKARHVGVPLVVMTQNPETTPATYWKTHAKRRPEIIAVAAATGIDVIDTYGAFVADSRGLAALLNSDGLHPRNAVGDNAGSQVWRDAVLAAYNAA